MQRTLALIKPDAYAAGHQGAIIARIQESGLRVDAFKTLHLTEAQAEGFYHVHAERPFFGDLVKYMTSGTVCGIHLRREDAVKRMRELVGATNPEDATAGTIRFRYGKSIQENAVHASDSPENADLELGIIFG